ncbi:MAG: L-aspartate oxidase [Bryobacteraceae bacterium]
MDTDFLVIGAGVAGLRAAIELARAGRVLVVAKDSLRESSSEYAQGGIAVALNDDDDVEIHEQDTLNAGDGLCDRAAVHTLVEEGPHGIQQLIEWGAEFDREGSKLLFAREGAHSRSRVLHAHGDSTGQEIARTLYTKAASLPNVSFHSFAAVTDLLLQDGTVCGVRVLERGSGELASLRARAVLLATGGLGQVYLNTTNPPVATGDGVAMAWRAGAAIGDIEFVQFHPTALHIEGAPRFLLSEALRGEGATLLNSAGERFMDRYHPMAELAPRDVVSRSILSEMRRTGAPHVFLDLSHREPGFVSHRFPRIYETCLLYGIDLERQAAPVHPAAHYAMGGVKTDLHGQTNIEGLFAAGEVACTGVHGANRLASNSLLEGLVFGARAGEAMAAQASRPLRKPEPTSAPTALGLPAEEVRTIAWEQCGILRDATGLRQAIAHLSTQPASSLQQVALLIARAALAREESRGGHFRIDFPHPRPEFQKHSLLQRTSEGVTFEV